MTYADVIRFYKEQLNKFDKLGLGKETEHGTVVTERLIENTKNRLNELQFQSIKKDVDTQVFRAKRKNADIDKIKENIYLIEYNLMRLKEDIGLVWNYVVNAVKVKDWLTRVIVETVITWCRKDKELNVKNLTNQYIKWVGDGGIPTGVMIKPRRLLWAILMKKWS